MKRAMLGIAALVGAGIAAAMALQTGPDLLASSVKALNKADGVSATFTVTKVGAGFVDYSIKLAKPNLARIEYGTNVIVADGKTITKYDTKDKTYYKSPQTDAKLLGLFEDTGLNFWRGFFDAKAFSKATSVKYEGTETRKGIAYKVLSLVLDAQGGISAKLYLHPDDGIFRQAMIVHKDSIRTESTVLTTTAFSLSKPAGDTIFAFTPPEGSKEVKEEDLIAGKWLTDLEQAKNLAAKTGKGIMVDFYADW